MKLPRWLVFGLVAASVLLPVVLAGWWIVLPELTVVRFRAMIADGQLQELDELTQPNARWMLPLLVESDLKLESRSVSDVLNGRRRIETKFGTLWAEQGTVSCAERAARFKMPSANANPLAQQLQITHDNSLGDRIMNPNGWLAKTVAATPDDRALVDKLFFQVLLRPPTGEERQAVEKHLAAVEARQKGAEDVLWTLYNTMEFLHSGDG